MSEKQSIEPFDELRRQSRELRLIDCLPFMEVLIDTIFVFCPPELESQILDYVETARRYRSEKDGG